MNRVVNVESSALDQGGGPGVLFNAMAGRAAEALGAVIIYHWANEVPPVAAQLALGATKGRLSRSLDAYEVELGDPAVARVAVEQASLAREALRVLARSEGHPDVVLYQRNYRDIKGALGEKAFALAVRADMGTARGIWDIRSFAGLW
ncbi:hypothetical protein A2973_01745 [Candidatus Gottesmanbacteria bacterium RIFCSPLOWO2_01_FULL_49_10]|uniref:Uncharacterized protein n=1 Tax=Candidatus Gottesmanbacteria bacterium RIFCSPLOWO2_01_FULL_49_10 TaxID=1798396 RepID=A0A1F6B1G2_9BACT|nr:MAG: hypothetical protein A2973_01745 [Candidatus Gottesmanbacteria bacterium RIFCSPLOWO2_01_FULL_49_10]